ncbi:MAG: acyltransferase [Bacteroidetes bacterium]|nr:acyltransferase [Bacteroidota bacterium]
MPEFLNRFRRITSSGLYIPEIDGLRFLAVAWIFLYHFNGYLAISRSFHEDSLTQTFFYNGYRGVELFFVISGFILSLPFADFYFNNGKKVSLKKYFLRRITRLEPPYFLLMILLFLALVISGTYTVSSLLPHLGASLLYAHNIFYPGTSPIINSVAWSLELEIQFYILIPFMGRIFLLKKIQRRIILLIAICVLPILQHYFKTDILFFYQYLQYPLAGFLLADIYICKKNSIEDIGKLKNLFVIFIGFILFALILFIPGDRQSLLTSLLLPFVILLFYWVVLFNTFWKKLFSIKWITIIGGMCYSIYLIHLRMFYFLGPYVLNLVPIKNYYAYLLIQLLILGSITFLLSAIFFYFIERPCMKKDWYKPFILNHENRLTYSKNKQVD